MKVIVVGDRIVSCELLAEAANKLNIKEDIQVQQILWDTESRQDFQRRAQNIENGGPTAEKVPEELIASISDADILLTHFCPVPRSLIEKGKKLKLIGTCRGGMEHVDVEAATEFNIPVIHVIRNAEATSDFAIGLIYSETRNIARAHASIMKGEWRKEYVNSGYTTTIKEMTLGVFGLGNIGKLVAKKAAALGMKVIAHDPYVTQEQVDEKGLSVTLVSLEEMFEQSDVLSIHVRATAETENLVGSHLLSLMKPTAYLINTSRAKVVNREDLLDTLMNKRIGGAAVDVFWTEPVPVDDSFLKLDNITITPHNAGNVVDALPKSPKLLVETINEFWATGSSDMVVNLKQLKKGE